MYKVIVTTTRPADTVRLFGKSSPANEALQNQFEELLQTAPGFVSSQVTQNVPKTVITRETIWESKAHFDQFSAANSALISELQTKRDLYQLAVGITRAVQKIQL